MGPFELLAEQHRQLEERFEALGARDGLDAGQQRERAEGRARGRVEAEEHLTMSELMGEVGAQPPGGPEWWARLMALEDLLVAHVREEEAQTFPRLVVMLDAGEQEALRRALETLRDELFSPQGRLMNQDGTSEVDETTF